jgi:fimbrial chaperone protein
MNSSRHERLNLWCLFMVGGALAWAAALQVHAADLQVAPISIQFTESEQSHGLWLTNSGTLPLRAQVRVQGWSQVEESDKLEPSRDLVASPPVAEIPPGERQLVRIVRVERAPPGQERSYRLIVDELPSVGGPASGLKLLLRYSIPVFVTPGVRDATEIGQPSARLETRIRMGERGLELVARNRGSSRVRISGLVHEDTEGHRTVLVPGLLGYVLAGQKVRWPLPPEAAKLPAGYLKARLNSDTNEQVLPLAAPDL